MLIKMKLLLIFLIIFIILIVMGLDYYFYKIKFSKDSFSILTPKHSHNFSYFNKYFQQIYVITLPSRKKYIEDIMSKIKLSCYYYPAFLKNNINKGNLISSGFLSPYHLLNDGQIACHLSHISVLKKFLLSDSKNCLIFEDDIKIPELSSIDVPRILTSVPLDYDIIYFGRCWDSCLNTVPINKYIVKCYAPQCMHAYGVSRKGAVKIINHTIPLEEPGDLAISKIVSKRQIIAYAPKDSIFFQNRELLSSNLNNFNVQKVCV